MNIVYPYNNRLLIGRAHDVLIVKTCYHLAEAGQVVFLLFGRTGPEEEILNYYGLSSHPRLHLVQLPILRKAPARKGFSWHLPFNLFCLWSLRRLNRAWPIDLVLLSEIKLASFLISFRPWLAGRWVYEVHGLYCQAYPPEVVSPDPRELKLYDRFDGLITTTQPLARLLQEYYGVRKPLAVVPLATDGPAPKPFQGFGRPARIFYFGQLYPLQGVDILIEAMKMIPQARLDVLGGRKEEIARLKSLAVNLGVGDRVFFTGFLPPGELARALEEAELLVIPARARGKMPFVAHTKVYEYLALGRPIVASDLPSIREGLVGNQTALLVPPEDPGALAQAIRGLVENEELARKLAHAASQAALNYTWEKRAQAISTFLKEVKDSG